MSSVCAHVLTLSVSVSTADMGQSFCPLPLIDEITLVRCPTARGRQRDKSLRALGPAATPPTSSFHTNMHALTWLIIDRGANITFTFTRRNPRQVCLVFKRKRKEYGWDSGLGSWMYYNTSVIPIHSGPSVIALPAVCKASARLWAKRVFEQFTHCHKAQSERWFTYDLGTFVGDLQKLSASGLENQGYNLLVQTFYSQWN